MNPAIIPLLLLSLTSLSRAGEPHFLESKKQIPTQAVADAPLREFLPHTVWHPTSKKDANRSLTFTTDGRMHISVDSGGGMIRYDLAGDPDSIVGRFSTGNQFRAKFSNDRKTMTIDGHTYTLQPHLRSAFSELVSKR